MYELLSTGPVHFDTLLDRTGMSASELSATLTIMEMSGAAKCLPGDRFVRSSEPQYQGASRLRLDGSRRAIPADTLPLVSTAVDFLRDAFHGVSVKYLQLCLGAYWCYRDRARWAIGSLLKACQKLDPIKDDDVRAYKSPVLVKVAC